MTNTLTTAQINSELEIVKLDGKKFKAPGGYYLPKGFALYHKELGYFAFEGDLPYRPAGGKKTLKEILAGGGFISFKMTKWLKEME